MQLRIKKSLGIQNALPSVLMQKMERVKIYSQQFTEVINVYLLGLQRLLLHLFVPYAPGVPKTNK